MGAKKKLGKCHLHYTTKNMQCPTFLAPLSSLGDMLSLKVKMADEDLMISQSSKLNYRHQNWQQFAGKTRLP